MLSTPRSDRTWYAVIGGIIVVVLAVSLTVYLRQSSGPDTSNPRLAAQAYFTAWHEQDVSTGKRLVCSSMVDEVEGWPFDRATLEAFTITSVSSEDDGTTTVQADVIYRGRTSHPHTKTRLKLRPPGDGHRWQVCDREDATY